MKKPIRKVVVELRSNAPVSDVALALERGGLTILRVVELQWFENTGHPEVVRLDDKRP